MFEHAGAVAEPQLAAAAPSAPRRVRRSSSRTRRMVSATSAPYAPTFCTGVAPAEPGIPDRHSSPPSPWASAVTTTSSHTAPASARTTLPSTVIWCWPAGRRSGRSASSASTTFDPPASTSTDCVVGVELRARRATTCSVLVAGDQPSRDRADAQCGQRRQRHRLRRRAHPRKAFRTDPTGGNGSLTSYAAFIRHGRRIRGQRRTGSPGVQRRAVLARAAGRFRRRRRHARLDASRGPSGTTAAST